MPKMEEFLYELTYLASPDLNDADADALRAEIDGLVVKTGGSIRESFSLAKRRLAYAIKRTPNAYLVTQRIAVTPEAREKLSQTLKMHGKVLRATFFRVTEKMLQRLRSARPAPSLSRQRERAFPKLQQPQPLRITQKPEEEKRADIGEIEKKLDEILQRPI